MKTLKKLISCTLLFVMVLDMTTPCYAQSYSPKLGKCPRCGVYNTSYGWDESFRNQSDVRGPGYKCDYCYKIVPDGESHFYLSVYDKYFFTCSGSGCSNLSYIDRGYTVLFLNTRKDHKIYYE